MFTDCAKAIIKHWYFMLSRFKKEEKNNERKTSCNKIRKQKNLHHIHSRCWACNGMSVNYTYYLDKRRVNEMGTIRDTHQLFISHPDVTHTI